MREKAKRLAGVAVFLACFLVAGAPILRVLLFLGNNSSHDTLIGFNRYCNERLGAGSPVYDFGDPFLDEYTRAVVESHNARLHAGHDRLRHYTAEYDQAGSRYFREMIKTFPADLVVRAYAAVLRTVDEMRPDAPWPRDIENRLVRLLYRAYGAVMGLMLSHGRYAVLLALLLIGARDVRLGLAALFLLGWFAGYPSLRFSVRHCFHMQIVSYLAAGFLVQRALDFAGMLRAREGRDEMRALLRNPMSLWGRYGRNAVLFAAIAAAAVAVPLGGLRVYQEFRVWQLLRTTANAPLEWLEVKRHADDGRVLFEPAGFAVFKPDGPSTQTEYLVVELRSCSGGVTPLTFVYDAKDPERDFTRIVTADLRNAQDGAPVRVYFPVYYSAESPFGGVAVAEGQADMIAGLYRARDFERVPVLLTAVLYPDWQDMPLHFKLTR